MSKIQNKKIKIFEKSEIFEIFKLTALPNYFLNFGHLFQKKDIDIDIDESHCILKHLA
jgi:hypothetical protein